MKKLFIVMIVLLSIVLTSCSEKSKSKGSKGEKVVIKYGIWDSVQKPVFRELADQFEKANPNIKVEIEQTPYSQYWTKLQASATGGVAPDVVWMNGPNIMKYIKYGMLLPLDSMMKNDSIDINNYVKGIGELYKFKGVQYGIPKDVDSIALWYNKELFDKAGVKYPTNDWTWNQMKLAAITIQKKLPGVKGVALQLNENQSSYYNMIPQNGGFVISPDQKKSGYGDKNTIEAIKMMRSLIVDKATGEYTETLENGADKMFKSGGAAMAYLGSWNASVMDRDNSINKKIGLVKMPKIKTQTTVVHGIGYAIMKNTKHSKEAWKFISFLASKESNDYIAKSGITIPAYVNSQELWELNCKNVDVSAYIEALKDNVPYPVSLNTAKWNQVENEELSKVWAGTTTPEEAAKTIEVKMNKVLELENK